MRLGKILDTAQNVATINVLLHLDEDMRPLSDEQIIVKVKQENNVGLQRLHAVNVCNFSNVM